METTRKKVCSHCKKEKDFNDFSNNTATLDGKQYWCRECTNAYCRKKNKPKEVKLNTIPYLKYFLEELQYFLLSKKPFDLNALFAKYQIEAFPLDLLPDIDKVQITADFVGLTCNQINEYKKNNIKCDNPKIFEEIKMQNQNIIKLLRNICVKLNIQY